MCLTMNSKSRFWPFLRSNISELPKCSVVIYKERKRIYHKHNNCLFCGQPCVDKYCSIQCMQNLKWEKCKIQIESTEIVQNNISGKTGKRYLLEKFGKICQICKMTNWFVNEMPLVLDHIDGNSENWSIDNCRLICPNCDTFTPFYKGRNKGNGRFKRRQRYLEGKSL